MRPKYPQSAGCSAHGLAKAGKVCLVRPAAFASSGTVPYFALSGSTIARNSRTPAIASTTDRQARAMTPHFKTRPAIVKTLLMARVRRLAEFPLERLHAARG